MALNVNLTHLGRRLGLAASAEVQIGQPMSPAEAMRLAIAEGHKGTGFVSPNPLVGCVILDRNGRFLAKGHHRRLGQDHAEIDALKKLNSVAQAEGAHFYVTLEPCAHQGRTPSCALTLAPLKLGSLTFAIEDPNPLVAGKGAKILLEAGVNTKRLVQREDIDRATRDQLVLEAADLAEIFLHNYRAQEPFVAAKVGASLDGKAAYNSGESKWITGEVARQHVQLVRMSYDAILIGRNTFIADNPSLNVRHEKFAERQNKAVVLDPLGKTLQTLNSSNLTKVRDRSNIFVVIAEDHSFNLREKDGVQVIKAPIEFNNETVGTFPVRGLLARLKDVGIQSVLIEGGAQTFGFFFQARRVQRLHYYTAPILIGGRHGVSWSAHFGAAKMSDRIELTHVERDELGQDTYLTARVNYPY